MQVTKIDPPNLRFLAQAGTPLSEQFRTVMPLQQSVCWHCVEMDAVLVIDDALAHPLLRNNPLLTQRNLGAYLGAPVHSHDATVIGTICAWDTHARHWQDDEIFLMLQAAPAAKRFLQQS